MRKNLLKAFSMTIIMIVFALAAFTFSSCGKNNYEIKINFASGCEIDGLEVNLFDFDGVSHGKATISNGKATFDVKKGNYVATLSEIDEEYDYQVAILSQNTKSATIEIKKAEEGKHCLTVYIRNFNAQNDYNLRVCEKLPDGTDGLCHVAKDLTGARVNFNVNFNNYNAKLLIGGIEFSSTNFTFSDANRYIII